MTETTAPDLHDFTLRRIVIDWEQKMAVFDVRGPNGPRTLSARGLRKLELTRDDVWGPSGSVNGVQVAREGEKMLCVLIEMQSGDEIRLTCDDLR